MQYSRIDSLVIHDYTIHPVSVEVVVRPGLPALRITGVAAQFGRDAAERLRAVLHGMGQRMPATSILVHVAPAELPKRSAYLDLALLAAMLRALQVAEPGALLHDSHAGPTLFLGELSLDGSLRPVQPSAALIAAAPEHSFARVVLPAGSPSSPLRPTGLELVAVVNASELLGRPAAGEEDPEVGRASPSASTEVLPAAWDGPLPVESQTLRAVQACAAGAHPLLMVGPPGAGKTTLAGLVHALLPPPPPEEVRALIALQSLLGECPGGTEVTRRPFRAPHHSVTQAGLVGGGRPLRPGEATRAHLGVLFLDEMAEIAREALQSLREPMESGRVLLARLGPPLEMPARFCLVAATNPCPCGYGGMDTGGMAGCSCTTGAIQSYRSRIRGPLLDRFDLRLFVSSPGASPSVREPAQPTFAELCESVRSAVQAQASRYAGTRYSRNAQLDGAAIESHALLAGAAAEAWSELRPLLGRRGRAGVRRLARTLADLSGVAEIRAVDLHEAMQLRTRWSENP